jgi:outer membrane lipoprotein-sorting protein
MFKMVVSQPKKALICTAALACAVILGGAGEAKKVAQSDPDKKALLGNVAGVSRGAPQQDLVDGANTVHQWLKSAQSYDDYSFDYSMQVFKSPGSTLIEIGKLSFKRPRLLRIEETGGPKAGSVAVLQADGKVHGHMGGGLKFFVATLSPDSNMLKSANGWPMCKSDFISLAQAVEGYLKEGCPAKVTATPVTVSDHANKLYDWQMYRPDGTTLYKRALFDPTTNQPVEWWDYINGKLYAHSTWTNFKPNQGFSEKVFTVKG